MDLNAEVLACTGKTYSAGFIAAQFSWVEIGYVWYFTWGPQ